MRHESLSRVVTPAAALLTAACAIAQSPTLLPQESVVGLANTVSGSRALNNLHEFTSYNRDRDAAEFAGTYRESALFAKRAKEYGFKDVEIRRYERGPMWDGIVGELWVVEPVVRKIADFKDIPTTLAAGSVTGVYEGEMVWVENASLRSAFETLDVEGKIVVTDSSTSGAFRNALRNGALGVVNMNSPRPYAAPDAILWSGIGSPEEGFGFNLSGPMMRDLRGFARRGPVKLKAVVEAERRDVDNEVITAVIPGDGSTDEWVYVTAHVYEGVNKQGAADDGSGAVIILEAGRTIIEAIERGYVKRPARNLRFVWVDEFSGTYAFIDDNTEEFSKATADINIDMAGQSHNIGNNSTKLYRMPDARIHFLGDVTQEFFEWMGRTNIEHVHTRGQAYAFTFPIVDPNGTRDTWRYEIEPFYGSSDHQVFNDAGVPAVLFNHWPDMVYHTSHDRTDLMDATQMKRSAFIAAATAFVVAGSPDAAPLQVAGEAYSRGRTRIGHNMREWTNHLTRLSSAELADGYKDVRYAVTAWREREQQNVRSALELTRGSTTKNALVDALGIEALASRLGDAEANDQEAMWDFYVAVAATNGVEPVRPSMTDAERAAAKVVPAWTDSPRTRVRARALGLPGFASMEVRNFVDGERSALDIRNAVNAEYGLTYGTIELEPVMNYLKALEEAEYVTLGEK